MKVIEMGGTLPLLRMLEGAKDDRTRREALKTLVALSRSGRISLALSLSLSLSLSVNPLRLSDEAVAALHVAGAGHVVAKMSPSQEASDVEELKHSLLERFREMKYQISSPDMQN